MGSYLHKFRSVLVYITWPPVFTATLRQTYAKTLDCPQTNSRGACSLSLSLLYITKATDLAIYSPATLLYPLFSTCPPVWRRHNIIIIILRLHAVCVVYRGDIDSCIRRARSRRVAYNNNKQTTNGARLIFFIIIILLCSNREITGSGSCRWCLDRRRPAGHPGEAPLRCCHAREWLMVVSPFSKRTKYSRLPMSMCTHYYYYLL